MMPKEHSSKDGNQVPAQRHRLEESVDEQKKHFTEERRRVALPRELIRPSPSEDSESSSGE